MLPTSLLSSLALGVAMLVLLEVGRRLGLRRLRGQAGGQDGARQAVSATDGTLFALLGLLIAFTFSGAATRFEGRRRMVVEESNAIGTAWLRLDLLPGGEQAAAREDFRHYVDARLAFYAALPDEAAARAAAGQVLEAQNRLWSRMVAAGQGQDRSSDRLLLPALNAMYDIAN